MKTISMHLNEEPFNNILSGKKLIEYRLNDEKRRQISIGDYIIFYKRPLNKQIMYARITDLKYYKNLYDMYSDTFDEYLKDMYKTVDDVVKDTSYYSEDEVKKCGCVAIRFEILDNN